jgi:flagellar operon protein
MDHRIHQIPKQAMQLQTSIPPKQKEPAVRFKEVLKEQQSLKLSKHASERLQERNIHISEELWQTIGEKVKEAKQKGVTDSLVVVDQAALLISAKNHTVVTALNREEAEDRIFTNINGTILINQ